MALAFEVAAAEAVAAALGTSVSVSGAGAAAVLAEVARLEAILTRFRDSPLTRLNHSGFLQGPPRELVAALWHALDVAAWTDGLVTPTVLPALEAAGYAGSLLDGLPSPAGLAAGPAPDWRGISVGENEIRLPPGVRLDLGGTAKTWIAERAARQARGNLLLDAGGDIVARQDRPFSIAIAHPDGGQELALELPAGQWGIATSSRLKRAWPGGHHLIDPRSGKPLRSPFAQVTVAAPQAMVAEVLAKVAFLDEALLARLVGEATVIAWHEERGWLQWLDGAFREVRA